MFSKGFTLIETMITLSIVVLLTVISIPIFRTRQQNIQLQANARNLLNDLRLAQQNTIGEQVTYLIKLFNSPTNKYQLIKRNGGDTVIKEYQLYSDISWQDMGGFTSNEIIYTTTGAVTQSGIVILKNVGNHTINIDIKPSGYVKISQNL